MDGWTRVWDRPRRDDTDLSFVGLDETELDEAFAPGPLFGPGLSPLSFVRPRWDRWGCALAGGGERGAGTRPVRFFFSVDAFGGDKGAHDASESIGSFIHVATV